MNKILIFDLSEVLILGLKNVEDIISNTTGISKKEIMNSLYNDNLYSYFIGETTEKYYIEELISKNKWKNIKNDDLKNIFRKNFNNRIPGMISLIESLKRKHQLVLLSDHGQEWIEYIIKTHPFLSYFNNRYFSFDLHHLKQEDITYKIVLKKLNCSPTDCVFIDDFPKNIEIAKSCGIYAIQFFGKDKLIFELMKNGIDFS